MPGGRLLVVDYQNKRYSVFDTAGTFLMSAPRRLFPGSVVKPWQGAVDSQGRVIEWQRVMSSDDPARLRGVLIRTDSTFAPRDTLDLALPEIDEVLVAVGGASRGIKSRSPPRYAGGSMAGVGISGRRDRWITGWSRRASPATR